MNLQKKGEIAFKIHQEVIFLKNRLTEDFIELGKRLHQIKEEELYSVLDYPTFPGYLASPEISFSKTTAYSLIDIYKTFFLEYKLSKDQIIPIGRTKLERLLPVVNEENITDWLTVARELSTSDLDLELDKTKGKKTFTYKYTKYARLAFKGDTNMEVLLTQQLNLLEWVCGSCKKYFWTSNPSMKMSCPHCGGEDVSINGKITYKDMRDN